MKKLISVAVACLVGTCAPAFADANLDLAKAKQCLSCHAVDKDTLAPSFKSIAKKYKKQTNAEANLVRTVMSGTPDVGGYHWGTMKMPDQGPRAPVSQDEAKQLVQWILSQS